MKEMHPNPLLAIIGGSGLYEIPGLTNTEWREVQSPWGQPSDALLFGRLGDTQLVFLPRHGRGHSLSPSEINYRANIDALKRSGVTDILSMSAVGSFRDELAPGEFVVCDQFIDRTFAREKTFFGDGVVAHVSMSNPVNARLGDWCEESCKESKIPLHRGGTYLAMEGPQFSTLAESNLYRQWGCDVIGMTNMPEAKLAREAEIPYCTVAMVTDYDCWHPSHEDVNVEDMINVLNENADNARLLVKKVAPLIESDENNSTCSCKKSLNNAIITHPDSWDQKLVEKLEAIAGRVLKNKEE